MDNSNMEESDRQQEFFDTPAAKSEKTAAAKPKDKDAAASEISFEDAIRNLEQVVAQLESADISLDKSLQLFQEGTRLSKTCSDILASIEHRVTQLVDSADGTMKEAPLSGEDQ